jgi:hypothetical protein
MKTTTLCLLRALAIGWIVCTGAARVDAQTLVPFYEYRYGNFEDFFYQTSQESLSYPWTYLGFDVYVYDSEAEGTVPLHRFYSSVNGKHFYTTDYNEVGAPDWTYEGVAAYIFSQQESGTIGLRRWYKWVSGGPVHFYTTYTGDDILLIQQGWTFEGVIGYAVPCTSNCY